MLTEHLLCGRHRGLCTSRAFSHLILTQRNRKAPLDSFIGEEKKASGEKFSKITQLDGDGADI